MTSVVYGVPKVARGLGFEDTPTDQVKADVKDAGENVKDAFRK